MFRSDYVAIDPRFGTLEDYNRLVAAVHQRGMKLLMDFVPNHTSEAHPWFKESRSSTSNPKRDWYIWRPPRFDADGTRHPPNQFEDVWVYDGTTGEYYLRLFNDGQPDLNWENPDVREAIYKSMRSWLVRGCDGFRMDAVNMISKPHGLLEACSLDSEKQDKSAAHELCANG